MQALLDLDVDQDPLLRVVVAPHRRQHAGHQHQLAVDGRLRGAAQLVERIGGGRTALDQDGAQEPEDCQTRDETQSSHRDSPFR